jgi:hypothetical protein
MIVATKEIGWVVLSSDRLFCKRWVVLSSEKLFCKRCVSDVSHRRPHFKAVRDSADAAPRENR